MTYLNMANDLALLQTTALVIYQGVEVRLGKQT